MDVGQALREARERKGISLREAQSELKIRERYLQALEENDFAAIPGEVYARGFLRSYARLLSLDADDLLRSMPHTVFSSEDEDEEPAPSAAPAAPPRPGKPAPRTVRLRPIAPRRPRQWPWVLLPLVFIVALLYALGSLHLFGAHPSTHPATGSGRTATGQGSAAGTGAGSGTGTGSGAGSSGGTAATQPLVPAAATTGPYGGPQSNYTVTQGPIATEVVVTAGTCYVYVQADGAVVVSQVLGPGTYSYTAQSRMVIKLGNPPDARLTIDGNAMPISGSAAQSFGVQVQGG